MIVATEHVDPLHNPVSVARQNNAAQISRHGSLSPYTSIRYTTSGCHHHPSKNHRPARNDNLQEPRPGSMLPTHLDFLQRRRNIPAARYSNRNRIRQPPGRRHRRHLATARSSISTTQRKRLLHPHSPHGARTGTVFIHNRAACTGARRRQLHQRRADEASARREHRVRVADSRDLRPRVGRWAMVRQRGRDAEIRQWRRRAPAEKKQEGGCVVWE